MPGKTYGPGDIKLPGWRSEQAARAVSSLLKFIGKQASQSNDLLQNEDELLYLQLALKKMPNVKKNNRPIPLPLPHPIYSPEAQEICLFVKDHKGEGHKEAKERIAKFERKGGVAKVIGISKLRTKYESFESKRELCKLYDLFLADDRIIPSLPKLIGKSFFVKKKQPIPIRLTNQDFPGQVRKACESTYMFLTPGVSMNIRVARSNQSEQQILENIHAVLVQAVEHIPKKWGNVQGVFLKTVTSVALPIFQTLPDEPALRIDAAAVVPASTPGGAAKAEPEEGAAGGAAAATAGGKAPSSKGHAAAAGAPAQAKAAAPKAAGNKAAAAAGGAAAGKDAGKQQGHATPAGQDKPSKKKAAAVKAEPAAAVKAEQAPAAGKAAPKKAAAAGSQKVKSVAGAAPKAAAAGGKVAGKRPSPSGKAAPSKKKAKQG